MQGTINSDGVLTNGYAPHPAQVEIHEDPTRFRICVCGRRFGKTVLALNEALKAAWLNQDRLARIWYIAPNYRQAKTVAWEILKEVVPEQIIAQINEAELSMRLKNGSVIELKGADAQDSLRGAKLFFVVLDEYASMRPNVWDEIVRPCMADVKGSRAIFIGTPAGFNHFKALYDRGCSGDKDYKSFRFGTLDNPYVDPQEIVDIEKRTHPTIFRQEYEASFEQMTGSVYPMFKRDLHVIRPKAFPEEWDYAVAMDWGSRNPTGVVFSRVDPTGGVWIYDTLYDSGKTAMEWSEIIKCRPDFQRVNSWIIDPSALAQAREFGQAGIFFHSYSPETNQRINDVNIGINLVSQFLLEGKIRIFEHCEELITQMEQYQWEPSRSRLGADPKPKPLKVNDHLPDALRYLVMTRPQGGAVKKDKYKGLDPASEMFWRAHNNDFPKEVQEILYPRNTILFGIDEEYTGSDIL